jgi:hypothetical protein
MTSFVEIFVPQPFVTINVYADYLKYEELYVFFFLSVFVSLFGNILFFRTKLLNASEANIATITKKQQ